ncbi:hypothetical protein T484DRAFT_1755112 [Baffinella frigidus]|nr:hypothetical protein T484DRAFT_1755112 [Cryptophyta sp. CCMP2293]
MLAWDIETTGFDPMVELVTVAAVYSEGHEHVYRFATNLRCIICDDPNCVTHPKKVVKCRDFAKQRDAFLQELDDAPILAAYNGISFDIPFIATAFRVQPERVMRWVLKSLDVFETCKRAAGRTFGLNLLLDLNGFESKTGSGGDAVIQARMGHWDKLGAYCLDDAKLTHKISTQSRIALPEGYKWRQQHDQRSHDPDMILFLVKGEGGDIRFEYGSLDKADMVVD